MGVYIKRMEMPKNEPLLVKINPDGSASTTAKNGYKKYEAVPVPPHGDLIDSGALAKHVTVEWFCGNKRMNVPWRAVEDAPTIIPTEPGEEEIT